MLLLQVPGQLDAEHPRPWLDPVLQLGLAGDTGQHRTAGLPALRRDRRPLRRLHPRIRRRRPGLGPSLLPALQLGDERQLVRVVRGRQRQPARRIRRRLAPRPRHLHPGGRDQRDLGLVPQRRPRKPVPGPQLALPRRRLRRLDRPRRLQLGHRPGAGTTAGAASTTSFRPPTGRSPKKSRPRSRW